MLKELQTENAIALYRDMSDPSKNSTIDPFDIVRLALRMIKDDTLSIFRRFDEVNMINLLYLQNEIQALIDEFQKSCPEDMTIPQDTMAGYTLASYTLRGAETHSNLKAAEKKRRQDLMLRLRSKIKEYSKLSVKDQSKRKCRILLKGTYRWSSDRCCSNQKTRCTRQRRHCPFEEISIFQTWLEGCARDVPSMLGKRK